MSKQKKNLKTWFNYRLNRLKNWFNFKKRLFQLWWADAPQYQKDLEKGNYYIRRGAVYQVGQPFTIQDQYGKRKKYINNLYFNFKENKITHSFSQKPVPGFTEKFEGSKKHKIVQDHTKDL